MKLRLDLIVNLVLLAAFCFGIAGSWSWQAGPRWYAWVVSIPGVALTGISLTRQLLKMRKETTGTQPQTEAKNGPGFRKEITFFSWPVALVVATWLFGFEICSVIFMSSYVKLHGGNWLLSIGMAILVGLVVWGLFGQLLHLPWVEGVVPLWLGL